MHRCDGCGDCETACAVEHSVSKDPATALQERPVPQTRIWTKPVGAQHYAARCVHCVDAPCVAACPNGAMSREAETGRVFVDESRCQGCFMCAMTCSFGAIEMNPVTHLSLKCDLCPDRLRDGRDPACVESCPQHALEFRDQEEIVRGRMRGTAATLAEAFRMMGGVR